MPLPIKKLVPVLITPTKSVTSPQTLGRIARAIPELEPAVDKTPPKSITVRMPANHTVMLEDVMAIIEADKSETIKRAIRLIHACMTGHDVEIMKTARDGSKTVIPVLKNSVPV